jgi:hypothetical protein
MTKSERQIAHEYREFLDEDPAMLRLLADLDTVYTATGRRGRLHASGSPARRTDTLRRAATPARRMPGAGLFASRFRTETWTSAMECSLRIAGFGAFVLLVGLITLWLSAALPAMRPVQDYDRLAAAPAAEPPASASRTIPTPTLVDSVREAAVTDDSASAHPDEAGRLHDRVSSFVTALRLYRQNRGEDERAARRYEVQARSYLTSSLDSRTADLESLGVYDDAGPGDEDGWPEPLSGSGDDRRYSLAVAFEANAGERSVENRGARIEKAMEFEFVRTGSGWKIGAIRRVKHDARAVEHSPVPTLSPGQPERETAPGAPTPGPTDTPRSGE